MKKSSMPDSISEKNFSENAPCAENPSLQQAEPDVETLDFLRRFARAYCPEPFVFIRPSAEADYVLN